MRKTSFYVSADNEVVLSVGYSRSVLYSIVNETILHIKSSLARKVLINDKNLPIKVKTFLDSEYSFEKVIDKKIVNTFRRLYIDLSDRCNFNCKQCFHANQMVGNQISTKILDRILDIPTEKRTTLAVLGGEPLTYPRTLLMEYLEKFSHKFAKIDLYTNSSLLDQQFIHFLKKCNIKVRFTFFSVLAEKHDEYTGVKGAFQKLLSAIDAMYKNGNRYVIALISEYEDIKAYQEGKTILNDLFYKEKVNHVEVRRPAENPNDTKLIEQRLKCMSGKTLIKYCTLNDCLKNINYHPCLAGIMSIDTSGDIYNCPLTREKKLGNVLDFDFGVDNLYQLLDWDTPLWSRFRVCGDCEFNFLCKECPPLTDIVVRIKNTGKLDKPYFCTYNPYEHEDVSVDIRETGQKGDHCK